MKSIEGLFLRKNELLRKIFKKGRRKKLYNKNFTIISNNCWGGMIYESYGLKKMSPTIGLFFDAKDYIKFISNLNFYITSDLKFINANQSKNYSYMKQQTTFGKYPIGVIEDIEIYFLHYKTEKEAYEKWTRRCKRVNFDNIIFKFNDQNNCTYDDVVDFCKLKNRNKLFFTVRDWGINNTCIIKYNQFLNKKYINTSKEPFGNNHKINITKYLNDILCKDKINL